LNDILPKDDIKGVVIATPAETHFTMSREAFLVGKHVYMEKPMDLKKEDWKECKNMAFFSYIVKYYNWREKQYRPECGYMSWCYYRQDLQDVKQCEHSWRGDSGR